MKHNQKHPKAANECGFSMIFVVFMLLAVSTLAAALASFTSQSLITKLNQNNLTQARFMALAGLNYIRQFGEDYKDLEGQTFQFGNSGQFSFPLVIDPNIQNTMEVQVRVVGTVHPDTNQEANYVIQDTFLRETPLKISFREDFQDFDVKKTENDIISTDPANNTFTIGNNVKYSFGRMYYTGTKPLNYGRNKCIDGACDFNSGFRMFFVSTYNPAATSNDADGLVFTWFNSLYNFIDYVDDDYDVYAVGGSSELGEMMGYAGDGRIYSGSNGTYGTGQIDRWLEPELNSGIRPPKMGVEFDNWWNDDRNVCGSQTSQPASGSRDDPGNQRDHIAYVFWGKDSPGTDLDCAYYWNNMATVYNDGTLYATQAGANSFDDNLHGWGENTPADAVWSVDSGSSFIDISPFAFRLEVERNPDPASTTYTLNAWLRSCSPSYTDYPCEEYFLYNDANPTNTKYLFADTNRFLCYSGGNFASGKCSGSSNNTPILHKTITLTEAEHAALEKIIFGFTAATGGATQIATFSEFIIQFIKATDYDASGQKRRVIDELIN